MQTLQIDKQSEEYQQGYQDGLRDSQPRTVIGKAKRIQDAVCEYFKYSFEDLIVKRRFSEYCYPRQVLCYLLMTNTRMGCTAIGRVMNRDHTTIIYSKKAIEDQLDVTEYVRHDIKTLIEQIQSSSR